MSIRKEGRAEVKGWFLQRSYCDEIKDCEESIDHESSRILAKRFLQRNQGARRDHDLLKDPVS